MSTMIKTWGDVHFLILGQLYIYTTYICVCVSSVFLESYLARDQNVKESALWPSFTFPEICPKEISGKGHKGAYRNIVYNNKKNGCKSRRLSWDKSIFAGILWTTKNDTSVCIYWHEKWPCKVKISGQKQYNMALFV